ncbi:MAG: hypothetical protein KC457_21095, partial [Myxococcales bacterium]|nr:hypothetical protein [Myxococcales bacterium]
MAHPSPTSPSPSPAMLRRRDGRWQQWSRRRRVLTVLGSTALGLLLLALVVVATAPRWAAGTIEAELETRVGKRLDLEVDIGALELSWSGGVARSVTLHGEGLDMEIEQVRAVLDGSALWSLRAEVVELEASGGYLDADRQALESLARRLRGLGDDSDDADRSWLRRRSKLTPEQLELRELAVAIDDGARRVTGTMAATVSPADRRVELRLSGMMAELGLGRPLRESSISSVLEPEAADGAVTGATLRFPLEVELTGLSTTVDEQIAVAGVHGSLAIVDALLTHHPALELTWVSRRPAAVPRLEAVAAAGDRVRICDWSQLGTPTGQLLVNTTTVGLHGGPEHFPAPFELRGLDPRARVVDIVYPRRVGGLLDQAA